MCKKQVVFFVRLSRKFLLLWCGRVLFANCLIVPFLSLYKEFFRAGCSLLVGINLFISAVILLRYKTAKLELQKSKLMITTGFFLKKTCVIFLSFSNTIKLIKTPLSSALGLSNVIIYSEGVKNILPPLTEAQLKNLSLIRTDECEN